MYLGQSGIYACRVALFLSTMSLLSGCGENPWNSPYRSDASGENIFYSSFSERPKYLDPARSYSENEWAFISQIYEPPLQYHFLRRPYELVPLAATKLPEIHYYAANGGELPMAQSGSRQVAYTDYLVTIQAGIRYQPHPAFSRTPQGHYTYWPLTTEQAAQIQTLNDFPKVTTRELTAADYVYQIKRLAFLPNHSPIAGLMAKHIQGFESAMQEMKSAYAAIQSRTGKKHPWLDLRPFDIAGVKLLDRYRYRVRVAGSYPQFVYWLAMNFFAPVPWEVERFYHQPGMREHNITLDWYPVGTGPYMLTENNPNLRMVLARNPEFRGERYPTSGSAQDRKTGLLDDAGRLMPFIDKAVYSLEKEAIPRWNKFLQGYYDNSGIASDSFDEAVQFASGGEPELTAAMRERGISLNTAVETSVFYTGFNMMDPIVGGDSKRARLLRRAVSIAVDMEEYVAIFRNGRGEVAQGPLPRGIFGYKAPRQDPNTYVYTQSKNGPVRRSIAEARQLMTQAGYPGGRDPNTGAPLLLNYDTMAAGPEFKAQMDWYRKQFKKLGIELIIRATDYNRFQEKMLKGSAQIYSWGWNADYPDPENFLFLLYGPNGKVEHQGENASNYANPQFDALFDRMKNLPNNPERLKLLDQMLEILRRDAPWIWGFFPKAFGLHHQWYYNAKPNLMANNTLKYKRIDPLLREHKRQAWNQPVTWPLGALFVLLVLVLVPAVREIMRRERRAAR